MYTYIQTLAVLKVKRKYLTDLREVSISPLTVKMNLSNLVLAVSSSLDKFRSTERDRLVRGMPVASLQGPFFSFLLKAHGF